MNETFDAGNGSFEEDSSGNSPIPFEYSDSGTWVLEGDETGPATYTLTSPEISVPSTAGIQVSFAHRYSIETEWDGLALEVSVDGGPFVVVPDSRFSQNGYTFFGLIGNHVLKGGDGFNGDSEGYEDEEFITSVADIGGVGAGGKLQIRFLGAFDEGARGPGIPNWEIDSVTVETLDDEDNDGMPDSYEESNGLNTSVDDAAGDLDGDTVSNVEEFLNATNPQVKDTDSDGLEDNVETGTGIFVSAMDTGTDPLSTDTDGDGLPDLAESGTGTFVSATDTGTDPNKIDTDGDGFDDAKEILVNTDPTDPNSKPNFPVVIGYWSFDDQGAEETSDLSPNGYVGTVNGEPEYVEGHSGAGGDFAISFDGVDDSVTTEVPLFNGLTAYTISLWVRFDQEQTGRTGFAGQNDVVEFGMINATTMQHWSASGGAFDTSFGPTADEWTHIAIVNSSEGRIAYIDGEEFSSGTAAGAAESTFNFNIGGDGIYDATGNFYEGQMDDVAIWEEALSPSQVAELFNGLPPIGSGPSSQPFQITNITYDDSGAAPKVVISWPSRDGETFAIETSTDLSTGIWTEAADGHPSGGETTDFSYELKEPYPSEIYIRARKED
ncbi:MAG: LamG-like jellyroll fold domain-containing protein [Verrucomicrobiales bacterium]